MATTSPAVAPRPLGILLAASLAIALAGMHYAVIGAMVKPLGDAYGWSRGDIAFALTITSVILPFTNIAVGALVDRVGARMVALPGIFAFSAGTALLGLTGPELWTWYAGYTALAILSMGVSSVVFTKLIVEHFSRRRGIALATALAGSGIVTSIAPSVVLALEQVAGLNAVYPLLGLSAFIIMIGPAFLFLPKGVSARVARSGGDHTAWREMIGSSALWRMIVAFLFVASCVGTFIIHFQAMMADDGVSRVDAARIALWIGPAMVVGRLGTGLLFDVLPTRVVAGCAFALPALACLCFWAVPLDPQSGVVLAILIGIGMGSEVDVVAYLTSRYFPLRQYGTVFAILLSVYGMAVGVAPWLVGKAQEATGNYDAALITLVAGVGIAIMLILSLGRPPVAAARD